MAGIASAIVMKRIWMYRMALLFHVYRISSIRSMAAPKASEHCGLLARAAVAAQPAIAPIADRLMSAPSSARPSELFNDTINGPALLFDKLERSRGPSLTKTSN
jgi:hypothetical protein